MTEYERLEVGSQSPDFVAVKHDGSPVRASDFLGSKTVFYFFPAAGSPGCTMEAVEFNNELEAFENEGFKVVGISPDSNEKLAKFKKNHDLNFELLSDSDFAVHKAFGAYGNKSLYGRLYRGVLRATIVVDAQGQVMLPLYNVKATGHVGMLLRKLGL
jgi:peroxiredoxin Q/BCP